MLKSFFGKKDSLSKQSLEQEAKRKIAEDDMNKTSDENTYRIEQSREKYRVSDEDMKYFMLAYATVFLVGGVMLFVKTDLVMRWNIVFFASLLVPYIALEIKTSWVSRKRKKLYIDVIIKESSLKQFGNLFVFYPEDDTTVTLNTFDVMSQVHLDTKYALNKLHEVKRYALLKKADAILDLKFQANGTASFLLGRKKKKD
jgi:hypothetical protein